MVEASGRVGRRKLSEVFCEETFSRSVRCTERVDTGRTCEPVPHELGLGHHLVLAVSSDGSRIAASGNTGMIGFWKVRARRELSLEPDGVFEFGGPRDYLRSIRFAADADWETIHHLN